MKNFLLTTLLLLSISFFSFGQTGNIQGTISDENGIYVPGATIIIESLGKGAISDFDGKFTFVDIPEGTYNIKITYIGFKNVEQEVVVTPSETTAIYITLLSSTIKLRH